MPRDGSEEGESSGAGRCHGTGGTKWRRYASSSGPSPLFEKRRRTTRAPRAHVVPQDGYQTTLFGMMRQDSQNADHLPEASVDDLLQVRNLPGAPSLKVGFRQHAHLHEDARGGHLFLLGQQGMRSLRDARVERVRGEVRLGDALHASFRSASSSAASWHSYVSVEHPDNLRSSVACASFARFIQLFDRLVFAPTCDSSSARARPPRQNGGAYLPPERWERPRLRRGQERPPPLDL